MGHYAIWVSARDLKRTLQGYRPAGTKIRLIEVSPHYPEISPSSPAQVALYACQQYPGRCEIPELRYFGQRFFNSRVAAPIHPCRNHDWRSVHALQAMDQQVTVPQTKGDCEHNILELLLRDRVRVRDWNVHVNDFRHAAYSLIFAERNHGCDMSRIGTRQLLCIFKTADIKPFPNSCHLSPSVLDTAILWALPKASPVLPNSTESYVRHSLALKT